MKIFLILLSLFSLNTCKNSKQTTSINAIQIKELHGTYKFIAIGENSLSEINPTITFDLDKNDVYGFSGCNRFSGTYKTSYNKISFGRLAVTSMACMGNASLIENQFLSAINQVNTFLLQGNRLTFLNGKQIIMAAELVPSKILEYTAVSRGYFEQIIVSGDNVSLQKNRDSKPITKKCKNTELEKVNGLLKDLDLENLSAFEIPSKAHEYDGAAIATLKITSEGKEYQSKSFDHGNPPKEIEAVVKEILSMAQNIE